MWQIDKGEELLVFEKGVIRPCLAVESRNLLVGDDVTVRVAGEESNRSVPVNRLHAITCGGLANLELDIRVHFDKLLAQVENYRRCGVPDEISADLEECALRG